MPVKRRKPKTRRSDYQSWQIDVLQYGEVTPENAETANPFELENWLHPDRHQKREIRRVWKACESFILRDWIRGNPGTRPFAWWLFDAPERQRLRLDGIGTPKFEVLNIRPTFHFGIPNWWLNEFEVRYYSGKIRGVDGRPLSKVANPRFRGVAPDPEHLPTFESQASYLDRHNLMALAESKRLKPEDYNPETIPQPKR